MTSRRTRASRTTGTRAAIAIAFAGAVLVSSAEGCGSDGAVVGGECAAGYTQCGLSCFDLSSDPQNCGACGHACPAGVACVGGVCGGSLLDATVDGASDGSIDVNDLLVDGMFCDVSDPAHPVCRPNPGDDGSGNGDGSGGDGSGGDGSGNTDGSAGDGGDGSVTSPDGCAPPFDTPQNCGSCGHVCVLPNDVCGLVDGGYACVPMCDPPLVECDKRCVDLVRDPNNCGSCGNACPSGYCSLATCQGTVSGNIMVIGHDFHGTKGNEQQAKLLTNAVFYNTVTTLRMLSFEHYANPSAVTNGMAILSGFASTHGIAFVPTPTSDDSAVTRLSIQSYDVVLVWDQPNAPVGTLAALGASWAPALSKFVQQGGIVIALDAADGTAEMPALETSAALLTVTGHAPVNPGTPADVPAAGLSIARGMTSVYLVDPDTGYFTTSEPASLKLIYVANMQGEPNQLLAVQKIVN